MAAKGTDELYPDHQLRWEIRERRYVFANQVFGGQHQNAQVNGDKAWTVGPNGPAPQLAQRKSDSSRFGSLRMAS